MGISKRKHPCDHTPTYHMLNIGAIQRGPPIAGNPPRVSLAKVSADVQLKSSHK